MNCDDIVSIGLTRQANAVMLSVVRGQLQKTEAPDRLTGIACLTEDQSDASTWRLSGNYSRGLCLHIPDFRLSSDDRNPCIATRVGIDGISVL